MFCCLRTVILSREFKVFCHTPLYLSESDVRSLLVHSYTWGSPHLSKCRQQVGGISILPSSSFSSLPLPPFLPFVFKWIFPFYTLLWAHSFIPSDEVSSSSWKLMVHMYLHLIYLAYKLQMTLLYTNLTEVRHRWVYCQLQYLTYKTIINLHIL